MYRLINREIKPFILIGILLLKISIAFSLENPSCLMDTIPVGPPTNPSLIEGTDEVCVGEIVVYTSDLPTNCYANWYVEDILQSSTSGTLDFFWEESGVFNIRLEYECDTIAYPVDTLWVTVRGYPNQPSPILGDASVCIYATTNYSTVIADDETCQWIVDGIIQISDSSSMSYYWAELGLHTIQARAVNDCGISPEELLNITVDELPMVNLGNDTTIVEGQSLLLDAENPECTFLWSTGDTTQTIVVTNSDNYSVVVSNVCDQVSDDIIVNLILSIDDKTIPKKLVTVLPSGKIVINLPSINIKEVQVWDMSGRLIMNSQGNSSLILSKNGVYLIRVITSQNEVFQCKIVR